MRRLLNPADVIRRSQDVSAAWLDAALNELEAPKTLTQRNWVQLMLADRYSTQFKVDKLAAIQAIATPFANKFPHP